MASAFHLVALPVATEEQTLAAAVDSLAEVEAGETVFFSEAVAWTSAGSGVAFTRLVRAAREHDVSLVASMNLGAELAEDLPGHEANLRYHAIVVFTRHGDVHVPQAKSWPEAYELKGAPGDEDVPLSSYPRANLVRFDLDEQLVDVRFFLGGDIGALTDHTPDALACDVLVSMARMPDGADARVLATLADAREAGVASTTLCINGFLDGVCPKIEAAVDAGRIMPTRPDWPSAERLRKRLYRYRANQRATKLPPVEIEKLARDLKRQQRIPIHRPLRAPKLELGVYPITIVM